MKGFNYTRLIIPAGIVCLGIYNLLNPKPDGEMNTFWWIITPFALLIGIIRFIMLRKQKDSEGTEA